MKEAKRETVTFRLFALLDDKDLWVADIRPDCQTVADCQTVDVEQTLPLRQCAVTRLQRPQNDLIRFVLGPDNQVFPDLKMKLPGRGAWVTAAHDCVEEASRARVFARAFRTSVDVSSELSDQVGTLLANDGLQRLSLANKAGLVTVGFAKVENAISQQKLCCLVHASDAGADGVEKLDRKYRASMRDEKSDCLLINCFTGDQLSLALGRSNVVHAALRIGGAAEKFYSAARRLQRYLAGRDAYEAA